MSPINGTMLFGLGIIAGFFVWAIRIYGRVTRHVAPMLERPRMSWNAWRGSLLVDGIWNGLPIRIESAYGKPPRLSVTLRIVTRLPGLEAHVSRSGKIEFRSFRRDRLGMRTLARVVQDELSMSGPPVRVAIAEYFTPARRDALRVLLLALGWKHFMRRPEGIEVSRYGPAPVHWTAVEARDKVQKTLVELQKMGG